MCCCCWCNFFSRFTPPTCWTGINSWCDSESASIQANYWVVRLPPWFLYLHSYNTRGKWEGISQMSVWRWVQRYLVIVLCDLHSTFLDDRFEIKFTVFLTHLTLPIREQLSAKMCGWLDKVEVFETWVPYRPCDLLYSWLVDQKLLTVDVNNSRRYASTILNNMKVLMWHWWNCTLWSHFSPTWQMSSRGVASAPPSASIANSAALWIIEDRLNIT